LLNGNPEDLANSSCDIGRGGTGFVRIDGGALFECNGYFRVGANTGSRGLLVIDGTAAAGEASTLSADFICVGNSPLYTATAATGNGEIALRNGGQLSVNREDGGRRKADGR
jgi:hypothetical protein